MAGTDPHRLATPLAQDPGGAARRHPFRTLLWTVVVLSTVVNMVASFGDFSTGIHLGAGIVTVLSAGTLAGHALRERRSR